MKRKFYFAKRIDPLTPPEEILPIRGDMSSKQVFDLYTQYEIEKEMYIHNGHWILRKIGDPNNLPSTLTPADVWSMCRHKIGLSDAVVAQISLRAYGTIAEVAYAMGQKNKPVYILPETRTPEEYKELWFSFTMSLDTERFWNEDDIRNIPQFGENGIVDLQGYKNFITNIIPPFLKP